MKKILIVDDELALLNVLKNRFSESGMEVTTATDGDEALEKMNKKKFDMILLDIMMPKKDGFQVLKELPQTKAKDTPVIVLTNLGTTEDSEEALKLGAKDYFVKAQQSIDVLIKKVKDNI